MLYCPGKHVMKPEEFRLLKEYVAETFGLVLDDSKESFLTRELGNRLVKLRLSSFSDYYRYLKYAPDGLAESRLFISLITNNETIFFREEPQLKVLADEILPALKLHKTSTNSRKVRILSAGCSSGEEVYTLAMLLIESGSFIWDWDIQIYGFDLDDKVLEKAKRGIYSGRSILSTPANYLDRYFRKCGDGYEVRDILRRITTFSQGNLLEIENYFFQNTLDIIFCRNVLIYFTNDSMKRVTESFATILTTSGHLFLGHSESLTRITDRYIPLRFPGTIIYKNRA